MLHFSSHPRFSDFHFVAVDYTPALLLQLVGHLLTLITWSLLLLALFGQHVASMLRRATNALFQITPATAAGRTIAAAAADRTAAAAAAGVAGRGWGHGLVDSAASRIERFAAAAAQNRATYIISIFFGSQVLRGLLLSSNAFEIYFGRDLLWSTLQHGRMPSAAELLDAIQRVTGEQLYSTAPYRTRYRYGH